MVEPTTAAPYTGVESAEALQQQVDSASHTLVLLRGPASCGRSTFAMAWMAKHLGMSAQSLRESGGLVKMHICSTADFAEPFGNGDEHRGDGDSDAAEVNAERVQIGMHLGITPIMVDDAHMRLSEMNQYVESAQTFNYKVVVVHPAAFNREWHFSLRCRQLDKAAPEETDLHSADSLEEVGFFDDESDCVRVLPSDSSRSSALSVHDSQSPDRRATEIFSECFSAVARRRSRPKVDSDGSNHTAESDAKDHELWNRLASRAVDRCGAPEDAIKQLHKSGMPGQPDSLATPSAAKLADHAPARIPSKAGMSWFGEVSTRLGLRRPPETRYESLRDVIPREKKRKNREERGTIIRRACGRFVQHRARSPEHSCSSDESTVPSVGKSRSMAQLLNCFPAFFDRCPGFKCFNFCRLFKRSLKQRAVSRTWENAMSLQEFRRQKAARRRGQHRQKRAPEHYNLSPSQSEDEASSR